MRRIDAFVLHCSATHPGQNIGAESIRRWHTSPDKEGGPFSDIGYHFVIRRDGTIEKGRSIETIGAHAKGHNRHSIGICLVGGVDRKGAPECNYTREQWRALDRLESGLRFTFPYADVIGHRDLPGVTKACPSFSAGVW